MATVSVSHISQLPAVAQQLLQYANGQKFFVFEGEMAAGKTTFIKAFCKTLGVEEVVSSPTFSIVNEYDSPQGPVYHFDFYRLKNLQEAYDIGYEEYFYNGHYCLIEWPSKVEALLPENYIKVKIDTAGDGERVFNFSSAINGA